MKNAVIVALSVLLFIVISMLGAMRESRDELRTHVNWVAEREQFARQLLAECQARTEGETPRD